MFKPEMMRQIWELEEMQMNISSLKSDLKLTCDFSWSQNFIYIDVGKEEFFLYSFRFFWLI